MVSGAFSGAKLSDYFRPGREDWAKARAIINGADRAELVAGYGRVFWEGLGQSEIKPSDARFAVAAVFLKSKGDRNYPARLWAYMLKGAL